MGLVRFSLTAVICLSLLLTARGQESDPLEVGYPEVSFEIYFKKSDRELSGTVYKGHTRWSYTGELIAAFRSLLKDSKIDSIFLNGQIPIDFSQIGFLQTRLDEVAIAVMKFRIKPEEECRNASYYLKHDRIRIFATGVTDPISITNSSARRIFSDSLVVGFQEYLYSGIPQKEYAFYFEEDCENSFGKEVTLLAVDFRFITALEFQPMYIEGIKGE